MDATLFDQLEQTVKQAGPTAAVDKLCAELKSRKEGHPLSDELLGAASFMLLFARSPMPFLEYVRPHLTCCQGVARFGNSPPEAEAIAWWPVGAYPRHGEQ